MNETKLSFARYEKKYLLSAAQYSSLWARLAPRFEEDEYFQSLVCSLYYDDDSYSMIRRSLERPVFKEKLRLRSYGVPAGEDAVFVELKKKFKGMVYKRRMPLPEYQAISWLSGECASPEDSLTAREITWLLSRRALSPRVYIACDREAYVCRENKELRLTFDRSVRFRSHALSLSAGSFGEELLEPGQMLMEIKMPGSAPLWLANMLSESGAYPVSFSKYGESYKAELLLSHSF